MILSSVAMLMLAREAREEALRPSPRRSPRYIRSKGRADPQAFREVPRLAELHHIAA